MMFKTVIIFFSNGVKISINKNDTLFIGRQKNDNFNSAFFTSFSPFLGLYNFDIFVLEEIVLSFSQFIYVFHSENISKEHFGAIQISLLQTLQKTYSLLFFDVDTFSSYLLKRFIVCKELKFFGIVQFVNFFSIDRGFFFAGGRINRCN